MSNRLIITQIAECTDKIENNVKAMHIQNRRLIMLFKRLSDACEHEDEGRCRHGSLEKNAGSKGVTAYLNGCTMRMCPLLKGE